MISHPSLATLLLFVFVDFAAAQPAMRERQILQRRLAAEAELVETLKQQPADKLDRSNLTESEKEKAHSLALFGKGRLLFQQEEYGEALKAYQRAWQWNPSATSILHEIVRLTFHLERHGAAVRYAVLANERSPKDPDMMLQLGMVLAQDGEPERGLRMLQSALKLRPAPRDKTFAEMHFNLLRLAALSGKEKEAVNSVAIVREAHNNPDAFELAEEDIEETIGERRLVQGLFVEIFLESGEFDQAETAISELARMEEDSTLITYYRARLALKRGDAEKCVKELEAYTNAEGVTAGEDAYMLLEEAFKKLGKSEKEIARKLQSLADRDPSNDDLALFTARKLDEMGDSKSVQLLIDASINEPGLDAHQLLLNAYIRQENVGRIVVLLGKIVDKFGSLSPFSQQIEQITENAKLRQATFAEAKRRLDDRRRPMLATESLACSYLALSAKDVKLAEEFFAHTEQNVAPDALTLTRLGYAEECFFSEQNEPAIRIFRQVLDDPSEEVNLESVVELLAMAQEYDGRTSEALATIDAHLTKNDSAGLSIRRAWVLYHAKRNDDAKTAYEQAIGKFEDNFDSSATRRSLKDARMVLSNLYVADGNITDGTEVLLKVLDEFPEDVGAMNDLGYLWTDNGIHLERSLSMIKRAVEAEPGNAAYLDSLAWAYVKMNRPAEALPHLEKAIANDDKPDGVILDHLGDVHLQLGNKTKAVEYWKQAIPSLTKSELADKVKHVEIKIRDNQ